MFSTRAQRFTVALVLGVCLSGMLASLWQSWHAEDASVKPSRPPAEGLAALRYARNVQAGDWEAVVDQTRWMSNRLRKVRAAGGDEDTVRRVREELRTELGSVDISGNQMRPEGIEDPYVFAADAEITLLSTEKGQTRPEAPVACRAWLLVRYPERRRAPLDTLGLPVRSLRAGIDLDENGQVLKANVVGNLDIDWQSFTYGWEQAEGE